MRAFTFLKSGCFQAVFTSLVVAVMVFRPVIPVVAQVGVPPLPQPTPQAEGEIDAYVFMEATVEAPDDMKLPGQADPPPSSSGDPAGVSGDESDGDFPELVMAESAETIQVDQIVGALSEYQMALVDEFGNTLPLASTQAAEILAAADPYFSADGITYGWTNAGTSENPSCGSAVTQGYCTFSSNPITDAIDSPLYIGQRLTIEDGDYTSDNVVIAKAVNLDPRANLTVASVTLMDGALVNWSTSGGPQNWLTSLNIFVQPGAYLQDALEVAAPGAAINLAAGTFDKDAGVDINKTVSILGAAAAETIIIPHSSCSRCSRYFLINADDVKIQNITFNGMFKVDSAIMIDNRLRFELSQSVVQNYYRNGILIADIGPSSGGDSDTISTATYNIHDNTFDNSLLGGANNDDYGIRIIDNVGPAADHLISNNIFTYNNRGIWMRDSSATITGNDFFANKYGIYVDDLDTGHELVIQKNRFSGNTSRGVQYNPSAVGDPVLYVNDNWWGCNGGANQTGCDTISATRSGKIIANSFLKLVLTAYPAVISVGETAALEAVMVSSADALSTPIESLKWFNPQPGILLYGAPHGQMDGNTFTAAGVGVQNFLAVFDNASAQAQIVIEAVQCQSGWNDDDGDGNCEPIVCDDNNPRTENILNPDGSCSYPPVVCDDENPATENILNPDGSCSYPSVVCDDENPATENILNPDGTCSFPQIVCDDGLATTENILNPDGTCSFPQIVCDDGLTTTENILNQDGTCSFPMIVCDDGLATTENILNQDGTCSFPMIDCDDGLTSTENILNQDGTCSFPMIVCDDGLTSTENILNQDGTCSFPMIVCDDGLATTENILNQDGSCSFPQIVCDDGLATTENILNHDGSCSFPMIVCDDGLATTENILNQDGSCSFPMIVCDDGLASTENILNPDGSCSFPQIVCDDGLASTENILNPDGTCSFPMVVCDDGLATTENILNQDGSCSFPLIVCDDSDSRTENILNQDGTCSFPQIVCDDGLASTENILNMDGSCSYPLVVCDDDDLRTENILNMDGSCSYPLVVCIDDNPQTVNILNMDGSCSYPLVVCNDDDPRTENILNMDGSCSFPQIICDDGDPATMDTLNNDGSCSNVLITCPPGFHDSDRDGVCESLATGNGASENFLETIRQFFGEFFRIIPVTGGLIDLDADLPAVLALPGGGTAAFSDPLPGFQITLTEESLKTLPSKLPEGYLFGRGITINLVRDGVGFHFLPEPVTFTLQLPIPPELQDREIVLLYWDAGLNGGSGGWVEILLESKVKAGKNAGKSFPNFDGRAAILDAAEGDSLEVRLNFTGTFILAAG
jgi:parallel beta-helix repeat protein